MFALSIVEADELLGRDQGVGQVVDRGNWRHPTSAWLETAVKIEFMVMRGLWERGKGTVEYIVVRRSMHMFIKSRASVD